MVYWFQEKYQGAIFKPLTSFKVTKRSRISVLRLQIRSEILTYRQVYFFYWLLLNYVQLFSVVSIRVFKLDRTVEDQFQLCKEIRFGLQVWIGFTRLVKRDKISLPYGHAKKYSEGVSVACGLRDRGSNLDSAKNVYSFIAPSFLNFYLVDH